MPSIAGSALPLGVLGTAGIGAGAASVVMGFLRRMSRWLGPPGGGPTVTSFLRFSDRNEPPCTELPRSLAAAPDKSFRRGHKLAPPPARSREDGRAGDRSAELPSGRQARQLPGGILLWHSQLLRCGADRL